MIHRLIKSIADSIIKIFTPILIFQRTGDLLLCFIYFLISYSLASLLFFLGRKIIQKIPVVSVILSMFLIVGGNMLLLFNLNIWSIILISFIDALYSAMYYGAINMIFGLLDSNANTAKFEGGECIGKAIFTILSAYVLGEYQNSLIFVFLASIVLYVICVVPLCIKFKKIQEQVKTLPKQSPKIIFKDIKKFNIYHFIYGIINFSINSFLPLFLFVRGLSFTSTGFLMALQSICSFATGFLTNYTEKKKITKYFISLAALLMVPAFLIIMLVNQTIVCYICTFVLTLANNFVFIALYRRYVLDQTSKNFYHYSVFYRDVFLNMGGALSSVVLFAIPFYPAMFGISIASSVVFMFSANSCLKQTNSLMYSKKTCKDPTSTKNKNN